MPHDEVEADQLASPHLDGTYHRAAFSTAALCEVRRASSIGKAVANGGHAGQAVGEQRMISHVVFADLELPAVDSPGTA